MDSLRELAPDIPLGDVQCLAQRGELHRKSGRYDQAVADFDRVLKREPDHAWALARRASALLVLAARRQRGGTRNALDGAALELRYRPILSDLERALCLNADDAWARRQKIEVLRCMKRHVECRDECTRMLLTSEPSTWLLFRRAWSQRWLLDFDDALADVERALRLDGADRGLIGYRGLLLGMMRRTPEAMAQFDLAMEFPNAPDAWKLERGIILVYAGLLVEAVPWLHSGLAREDAYLGHYFLAVIAAMTESAPRCDVRIEAANEAARRALGTEAWPIGRYMSAGLHALTGERAAAAEALLEILPTSDIVLEAIVCDPVLRRQVAAPEFRRVVATVRARLAVKPQAAKYIGHEFLPRH